MESWPDNRRHLAAQLRRVVGKLGLRHPGGTGTVSRGRCAEPAPAVLQRRPSPGKAGCAIRPIPLSQTARWTGWRQG
jgi:hypothetical protein